MTADYIAFHATERPDAVALLTRGGAITFSAFSRDVERFTRAVRELGVPRGGSVAVGCGDIHTQWLLLLACEQLGIAAACTLPGEEKEFGSLLADVDLVLTEPGFPDIGGRRRHAITPEWLAHARSLDGAGTQLSLSQSPDDPVCILRTSGTTGRPKRILHTRSLHDARVTRWIVMTGFTRRSRLLLTIPFVVNSMYSCATACLRAGGTAVLPNVLPSLDTARTISEHAITDLPLLPFMLERVLDSLPAGFVKPPALTLICGGAAISSALHRRALALFATEIIDIYGSNEAALVASTRGDAAEGSAIWPDVRVEIVDDQDVPLLMGQPGWIRIKSPYMVHGYLGDPEATDRIFKGGWFYPGDRGILQSPHQLRILGRGDEVLNLGGSKIYPETLEQAIRASLTLADIGVCSERNPAGIEELLIGVVDAPYDDRELGKRLTSALKQHRIRAFHGTRLPQIPRTATGKIKRDLLKRAILTALGARETGG